MQALIDRWIEQFRRENPNVVVHPAMYGSGTAAGALVEGAADIAPLARQIDAKELALFAPHQAPIAIPVGFGSFDKDGFSPAVAVYVHGDNPIRGVTTKELAALLSAGGDARRWRSLHLANGLVPDCSIRVYGVRWSDGKSTFLRRRLLNGRRIGRHVERSSDPPGKDICALGLGSAADAPAGTRIIPVTQGGDEPLVEPSPETIASGRYPLVRSIYLYVPAAGSGSNREAAADFVKLALSERGQRMIAGTPFSPLPTHGAAKH